ncbi:amidohydrolase [bacterium]|nr:amidohydrolase [bacterium]
MATTILLNGKIATMGKRAPFVSALALKDGRVLAAGEAQDALAHQEAGSRVIDLGGRTVVPGLNDSHLHIIREGLNYNLELRWDGVPSLAIALDMLRRQAERTPPGQWVRVVGGWSAYQFEERRLPTLDEINEALPDTPAFILHLYDRAFINRAGLCALGLDKQTPDMPGGTFERDAEGNPTGLVLATPAATILYATLAKIPKLTPEQQRNSTRQFLRELNRFGITSAIDAGGGAQNYPDDYAVCRELAREGLLTVRIAYYLFAQNAQHEFEDFSRWVDMTHPGQNDDMFKPNGFVTEGGGENLVWAAADFENFVQPRPELPPTMEAELTRVMRLLVSKRWPFRIHATYDESIGRDLDVFEAINKEIPFNGLRWFIDHAETVSARNLARIKALGGGIAIQNRMAFQGEDFIARYGKEAASHAPPIQAMREMGIPLGAGTDATRVASYNPWLSLHWLVTGKTLGGTELYPASNRLDRMEALRLYTEGSAWFSHEEEVKGRLEPGCFADLCVLTEDYFTVSEDAIKGIESVLTLVAGEVVHAAGPFAAYAPEPLPVMPEWSPVAVFGGYYAADRTRRPGPVTMLGEQEMPQASRPKADD